MGAHDGAEGKENGIMDRPQFHVVVWLDPLQPARSPAHLRDTSRRKRVSESTMLALMGHISRAILEHYSHIRMAAKRDAVAGITLHQYSEAVPVKVLVVAGHTTIE